MTLPAVPGLTAYQLLWDSTDERPGIASCPNAPGTGGDRPHLHQGLPRDRRHLTDQRPGGPNHRVSAASSPVDVPSPTQATCPSGRTSTVVGGGTAPTTGSTQLTDVVGMDVPHPVGPGRQVEDVSGPARRGRAGRGGRSGAGRTRGADRPRSSGRGRAPAAPPGGAPRRRRGDVQPRQQSRHAGCATPGAEQLGEGPLTASVRSSPRWRKACVITFDSTRAVAGCLSAK